MLLYKDCFVVLTTATAYMVVYNVSVGLLFGTIFQLLMSNNKTLYSLANFNSLHHSSKLMTISIFSMAGVPPFIGFFSKVWIFTLLADSSFFILFFMFFPLIFFSLYFYVQNIRFLNTSKPSNTPVIHGNELRSSVTYYSLTVPTVFILTVGMFFVDDLFFAVG